SFDDLNAALVGGFDDACCFFLGQPQLLCGLVLRQFEIAAGAIGGFEAVSDLFLALSHRVPDVLPHKCVDEPPEEQERDGLADKGEIDVHAVTSAPGKRSAVSFQRGAKYNSALGGQGRNDNEQHVHADTNTDHRHGVEQTGDQEHLALQHRSQFRLTRRTCEQFATEQCETERGTQSTQTNQQRYSNQSQTHFSFSQVGSSEVEIKTVSDQIDFLLRPGAPCPCRRW